MSFYQVGRRIIVETGNATYQTGRSFIVETFASAPLEVDAENDLIFTQSCSSGLETESASSNLLFTETCFPGYNGVKTAEDDLEFSQSASPGLLSGEAENDVLFTQEASTPTEFELSGDDDVLFTQSARSSLNSPDADNDVLFTQLATKIKVVPGVELDFEQTVLFTQTALKVKIVAGAIAEDAESDLLFTHSATLPTILTVQQFALFSQTATTERIKFVEQDLEFTHDVDTNLDYVKDVEQECLFTHAFAFELNSSTCDYSITVGGTTDPNAPTLPSITAPVLVRQSYVELFYPLVSPTSTVRIRAPEFGDRDRLTFDKIHRETRGGTLRIFADVTWPKLQVIEMQFTGLTEAEAQAVLDFFDETLGLTVGFTDWEGQVWHGVVVNPDQPLIRARRNIVDLSFEFEGELQ